MPKCSTLSYKTLLSRTLNSSILEKKWAVSSNYYSHFFKSLCVFTVVWEKHYRICIFCAETTDCLYVNSTLTICFLWWGGRLPCYNIWLYLQHRNVKHCRTLPCSTFFSLIYWRTNHILAPKLNHTVFIWAY